MDKIVEGVLFKKARFLRTTCKNCGKSLTLKQVKKEKKWCSCECNLLFVKKKHKKKTKYINITKQKGLPEYYNSNLDDDPSWDSHKDSC